jgi:hypothetical protein
MKDHDNSIVNRALETHPIARYDNSMTVRIIVTDLAPCTIRRTERDDLPTITAIYRHHMLHGLASKETAP